ncbi:MAG: hypothetical protein MUF18_20165 [Fimbriiglobus sp.]|jgi:hypothetical protein|nr:hypothetical protein [Fimbriiglobus sp.]
MSETEGWVIERGGKLWYDGSDGGGDAEWVPGVEAAVVFTDRMAAERVLVDLPGECRVLSVAEAAALLAQPRPAAVVYREWAAACGEWDAATAEVRAAQAKVDAARRKAEDLEQQLGELVFAAAAERVDGRGRCEMVVVAGVLLRAEEESCGHCQWRYSLRAVPVRKLAG